MAKIIKMTDNKDKVIDQLIDDKNRIYMKMKHMEKKIEVYKSQIEHWKLRYKMMAARLKEKSNEELNSRAKA